MNIISSWDIQKALLAGHSGPSRERMAASNMPTLDDVTERCPHCQKMARYETYQSRRDGQLYHVELIRCSAKDCKQTTKTETLIGEDMPIIPQEVRDRYKIARNRLKMTDIEAAQKLGFHSRNVLSSILCHGSASEERAKAFTDLVEEMETKTHLLDQADGIVQIDQPKLEFESYEQERASDEAAAKFCSIDHLCNMAELGLQPAPSNFEKLRIINEAVSTIRRIPIQFRELLLDLARHEDAADQARTVLERNLNA